MKLVALLLILVGCNKSTNEWDELTEAERRIIRQRQNAACRSEVTDNYQKFKDSSAATFTSSAYQRNDSYKVLFKEGSSTKKTTNLQVWKQDTSNEVIYFYVSETLIGTSSYFLKLSRTQNEEIIDDLLDDHCGRVYESSAGSTSVTAKYEFDLNGEIDNYTDTYTLNYSKLAYFAAHSLARKYVKKDTDGDVTSTTNYTSELTTDALTDFVSTNYADTYVNTSGTTVNRYTQNFCEITYTTGTIYRFVQDGAGFKLNCTTVYPDIAGGWDLTL